MQPISLDQVILRARRRHAARRANPARGPQRRRRPLEQGVAIDAAGLPHGDRGAMLALRAARLIRTRGTRQSDKAETYHDRVRETIVRAWTDDAVRIAHARIAQAMERYDIADPERMVDALQRRRRRNARRRDRRACRAMPRRKKLAFNRAAELYRRAIELLPDHGRITQRELYRHLGDALANAGRGAQAAEAYLTAAEGAEPAEERKLQRMAAQQYLRSGRIEEGTALARRLFKDVGLTFPETVSQSLLSYGWNKALLGVSNYSYDPSDTSRPAGQATERLATLDATFREIGFVNLVRGASLQIQFLRYAQEAKDPERVMQGLAWQAWRAAMTHASPRTALRILAQVERMAVQLATPYAQATAKSAQAGCALFSRRPDEVCAPALAAEELRVNHCAGSYWEQNVVAAYRYAATEYVGGFRTVVDEAPNRAREAAENDRFGQAFVSLSMGFSDSSSITRRRQSSSWINVLGKLANQVDRQREDVVASAEALLSVPETGGEVTDEGVAANVASGSRTWTRGCGVSVRRRSRT